MRIPQHPPSSSTRPFAIKRWRRALPGAFLLAFLLAGVLGFALLPRIATAQQVVSSHRIQGPRDWINVRTDFGAMGNGIANDTAAFANAIAAYEVSQTAAYILVPPGTYLVDDIKVMDGHIKGSGKSRTIIKARTTGSGAGIMRRDPGVVVQQLTVEDLQLQGFQYGIDARGIYFSEFRNLYVWDCATGIYLGRRNSSEGLSMADVFIDVRVVGSTAFTLDVDVSVPGDLVNACQFHSCIFESNTGRYVRFNGQGGNGLAGNSFHGCSLQGAGLSLTNCNGIGWYGGYIEGGSIDVGGNVGGLTISGTYFQVGSGTGIRLGTNSGGNVRGVTIGGCTFASTGGGTGIEVRSDMSASSRGIVLLPNEYLGSLTTIDDPAHHAEFKVAPGVVTARGYVEVSNSVARVLSGSDSPQGVVSAPVGSVYLRTNGGLATTLYVKESGTGTSGWIAK